MDICRQTRRESYKALNPNARYAQILDVLKDGEELTAREIMQRLNYTDTNTVKPRLTELRMMNMVKVIGKRKCTATGKTVSVYKIVKEEKYA